MSLSGVLRWFLLVVLGLTLTAVVASCGFGPGDSTPSAVDLPEGIPPEFSPLFEVYLALEDEHFTRNDLDPAVLSEGAIRGMLEALDDPHAAYLSPDLFLVESERFTGSFQGIGAEVSLQDGQIVIVAPIPDTPAERAGIKSGDMILEVNGESTQGMGLFEVVARIRGPEGTPVNLLVLHSNASDPLTITIVRGVVEIPTVELVILTGGLAHLKLNTFGETGEAELLEAFERIERFKVKGLVLDLRNNTGGLVSAAMEMTSQFLTSGLVLYQIDGQGSRIDYKVKSGGKAREIPLVVLVNGFTASSAEIMAGALRDHGRALIVGSQTFGKGSVNIQRPLSDGSGVYYTIARWYTPNGFLIEGEGIEPDVVVESDTEGEEDFPMDRAIEVLEKVIAKGG